MKRKLLIMILGIMVCANVFMFVSVSATTSVWDPELGRYVEVHTIVEAKEEEAAKSGPGALGVGIITGSMGFIGGIMIVFGAIQCAFGFKDEDPGSKTKGMMLAVAGAALEAVTAAVYIFAGDGGGSEYTTPKGNEDLDKLTGGIATWIPQLGIIVMVWGAVQFALAMKDDNAGEKIKAMKILAAGAALSQVVNFIGVILS